ncbi:MAG: indolepyruvate oxidoreductase subunit beta [Chloroflexota bacterium]
MEELGVLLVGVGGQGVILASDILAQCALAAGHDVKKTDTLGMAQRGGSVVSHVRMGQTVRSPLIKEGAADILVGLERLEAARWVGFLRQDGIAIVNAYERPPPSVNLGMEHYPGEEELSGGLRLKTSRSYTVEGSTRAQELGNERVLNMYMLGCLSLFVPIDVSIWERCMGERIPEKLQRVNYAAFDKGRREGARVLI